MNTREYIESGIIEKFVLGETNEEQTLEVMSYARQYPEIQAEIEAVENALINLAENNAHKPKANTREELFGKIFADAKPLDVKVNDGFIGSSPMVQEPMSKVVAFNKKYLVAASIALLASVGFNLFFYTRWKDSENAMLALNQEKQQFATIMASEKQYATDMRLKMDKINSMDVVQVKLGGMNHMPDAKAIVYYDTSTREVMLHVNRLPAAPADKQYQLWAIVKGVPVDAGVFDANELAKTLMGMKNTDRPSAFAVTIEKKGGSVNPTMNQMVLIGNVSS